MGQGKIRQHKGSMSIPALSGAIVTPICMVRETYVVTVYNFEGDISTLTLILLAETGLLGCRECQSHKQTLFTSVARENSGGSFGPLDYRYFVPIPLGLSLTGQV